MIHIQYCFGKSFFLLTIKQQSGYENIPKSFTGFNEIIGLLFLIEINKNIKISKTINNTLL
jgi:hypothetical protein